MPVEPVVLHLSVADEGAILDAFARLNDYGLAGWGIVSATPGPDPDVVTVELAPQPETALAQVRARLAGTA